MKHSQFPPGNAHLLVVFRSQRPREGEREAEEGQGRVADVIRPHSSVYTADQILGGDASCSDGVIWSQ